MLAEVWGEVVMEVSSKEITGSGKTDYIAGRHSVRNPLSLCEICNARQNWIRSPEGAQAVAVEAKLTQSTGDLYQLAAELAACAAVNDNGTEPLMRSLYSHTHNCRCACVRRADGRPYVAICKFRRECCAGDGYLHRWDR